ncbi:MAG: adenylyltransferase/cytidyltransferase family protein [Candidatus Nanohaloarchaea archaeon]|nr:adenylyltransferase/cytidyltransferase family protein [Candidatus Nanohaloarchaea archaeon]
MRVMAQGMFDVLHPGHIYYLQESAELGDELVVVVGRDSTAHNQPLLMGEETRLELVEALEMVDEARLGAEDDMFAEVAALDPDIITIGHDQPFDEDELVTMLAGRGLEDVEVVRIGRYEGPVDSSSQIRARIAEL